MPATVAPRRFTIRPQDVPHVPYGLWLAGVYALLDGQRWLYIGESKCVWKRLSRHLTIPPKPPLGIVPADWPTYLLFWGILRVDRPVVLLWPLDDIDSRLDLEASLIATHRPAWNTAPRGRWRWE